MIGIVILFDCAFITEHVGRFVIGLLLTNEFITRYIG